MSDLLKMQSSLTGAESMSMLENAPVNVLYADLNFVITYVNPKSLETLTTIERSKNQAKLLEKLPLQPLAFPPLPLIYPLNLWDIRPYQYSRKLHW